MPDVEFSIGGKTVTVPFDHVPNEKEIKETVSAITSDMNKKTSSKPAPVKRDPYAPGPAHPAPLEPGLSPAPKTSISQNTPKQPNMMEKALDVAGHVPGLLKGGMASIKQQIDYRAHPVPKTNFPSIEADRIAQAQAAGGPVHNPGDLARVIGHMAQNAWTLQGQPMGALAQPYMAGQITSTKERRLSKMSALGKTRQAVVDFSEDLLTDPLTYATFGLGALPKSVAKKILAGFILQQSVGSAQSLMKGAKEKDPYELTKGVLSGSMAVAGGRHAWAQKMAETAAWKSYKALPEVNEAFSRGKQKGQGVRVPKQGPMPPEGRPKVKRTPIPKGPSVDEAVANIPGNRPGQSGLEILQGRQGSSNNFFATHMIRDIPVKEVGKSKYVDEKGNRVYLNAGKAVPIPAPEPDSANRHSFIELDQPKPKPDIGERPTKDPPPQVKRQPVTGAGTSKGTKPAPYTIPEKEIGKPEPVPSAVELGERTPGASDASPTPESTTATSAKPTEAAKSHADLEAEYMEKIKAGDFEAAKKMQPALRKAFEEKAAVEAPEKPVEEAKPAKPPTKPPKPKAPAAAPEAKVLPAGQMEPESTTQNLESHVEAAHTKLEGLDKPHAGTAHAEMTKLEKLGIDTSDAREALDEYKGIVRSDYESTEDYQDANQEAWDNFIQEYDMIDASEVEIPKTEPAKPAPVASTKPVEKANTTERVNKPAEVSKRVTIPAATAKTLYPSLPIGHPLRKVLIGGEGGTVTLTPEQAKLAQEFLKKDWENWDDKAKEAFKPLMSDMPIAEAVRPSTVEKGSQASSTPPEPKTAQGKGLAPGKKGPDLPKPPPGTRRGALSPGYKAGSPAAKAAQAARQARDVAAETFSQIGDELKDWFSPSERGQGAKSTAMTIRENNAYRARRMAQAQTATSKLSREFERMTTADQLDFMDRMETGQKQSTPAMQKAAEVLRDMLDTSREQVRALGTGRLETFNENYFPHIWKDPVKAKQLIEGSYIGKRPLEGPKNFLQKRTMMTIKEGMEAGLEPLTTNPVEATILKLHEMQRFVMGQEIIGELKDNNLLKLVNRHQQAPEGWVRINESLYAHGRGEFSYFAPAESARVLNNFLSPGLAGSKVFRAGRLLNNALNQAQLGMSAFHLTFTSLDTAVSQMQLGINQMAEGQVGKGLTSVAKTPAAPIITFIRGNKLGKAYLSQGLEGKTMPQDLQNLLKGGGRFQMEQSYRTGAIDAMHRAFDKAKAFYKEGNKQAAGGQEIKGAFLSLPAMWEAAAAPVMDYIVPRFKLGVFAQLAEHEVGKLDARVKAGEVVSSEEYSRVLTRAWDSVDNRLGQLVYDNLFWHTALTDIGHISQRSLGWNLGSVREIGGGVLDFAQAGKSIATKGKSGKLEFTPRMGYVIALPVTVGLTGAVMQYLMTGERPKDIKDYFFPRTGRMRKDGKPERLQIASYVKDVYKGAENPVETITSKKGPVISLAWDMLNNHDFYGKEIRNSEDPIMKQIGEEASYIAKQFAPISLREGVPGKEKSPKEKLFQSIGITKAPYTVDMNESEKKQLEFFLEQRKALDLYQNLSSKPSRGTRGSHAPGEGGAKRPSQHR